MQMTKTMTNFGGRARTLAFAAMLCAATASANSLRVCKATAAPLQVPGTQLFSFTVDGTTTFSIAPGTCYTIPEIGVGNHTVTEAAAPNVVVSNIVTYPLSTYLVSFSLAGRSATVYVPDAYTEVDFFNNELPQGCTPGFWKQDFHFGFWSGYLPSQPVSTVFIGALSSLGSETLLAALQGNGGPGLEGAEQILLRAAVAALLNSKSGSIAFPYTTAQVVTLTNAALATGNRNTILALASVLDGANNGVGGCPIGGQNPA
jgi:hypothetical protein